MCLQEMYDIYPAANNWTDFTTSFKIGWLRRSLPVARVSTRCLTPELAPRALRGRIIRSLPQLVRLPA